VLSVLASALAGPSCAKLNDLMMPQPFSETSQVSQGQEQSPAIAILEPATSSITNSSSSITLQAICAPGAAVAIEGDVVASEVTDPAATLQSTCPPSGLLSVSISKTQDGSYDLRLHQTTLQESSSSFTWNRDATTPSAPVITSHVSPVTTHSSSLLIVASCENDAAVAVSGADTQSATCVAGSVSFTLSPTSDGTYAYGLRQSDAAGNTSASTPLNWSRDTTAPAAPGITSPAVSPYTSGGPGLVIAGTCEPDATVNLSGSAILSAACSAAGTYSFNVNSISSDGTYPFSVGQTDGAANPSATTSLSWVRNSSIPSSVVITQPASTPYSSSSDSLTLAGTCTTGYTVSLTGSDTRSTTCASGQFSFRFSATTDASRDYSVVQINALNTSSTAVQQRWVRDTIPPAVPTITSPATLPFNSNQSALTLAGICEAGTSVRLTLPDASVDDQPCGAGQTFSYPLSQSMDGDFAYTVSQTDAAGNTSDSIQVLWSLNRTPPAAPVILTPASNPFTSGDTHLVISGTCNGSNSLAFEDLTAASTTAGQCSNGSFSWTVTKNSDGVYSFSVKETDAYGNISDPALLEWTRNTIIPQTPQIVSPATTPYYGNSANVSLVLSCSPGMTVSLTNVTTEALSTRTCPSGGTAQVTFSLTQSAAGTFNYTIAQDNGVFASAPASFTWDFNSTAPAAVVLTSPNTNPFTSMNNLPLSGTCQTGTTVALSGDSTLSSQCSNGTFSFTITSSTDGTYHYGIVQTDRWGNSGPSTALTWVMDSVTPTPPVISNPALSPYYSNVGTFTVAGSCATGNTVSISAGTGTTLTTSEVTSPAGSLSQTCAANVFSFTVVKTNSTTAGTTYNFNLVQKNNNNNQTSAATSVQWIRDTTAPSVTVSSKPATTNYSVDSTFVFSSAEAGATFQCQLETTGAWAPCTSPVTYSNLAAGSHTFSIKATDRAGNTGSAATNTWTQQGYKTLGLYRFTTSTSTGTGTDTSLLSSKNSINSNSNSTYVTTWSETTSTPPIANGTFGGARSFDGTARMNTSSSTSLNQLSTGAKMTIEMFVQFTALPTAGGSMVLLTKSDYKNTTYSWDFRMAGGSAASTTCAQAGKYCLQFGGTRSNSTAPTQFYSAPQTLSTGVWYHVAATYNSGAISLYLNGALIGTGSLSGGGALASSSIGVYFGSYAQSRNGTEGSRLNGLIDEVRLSQVIRTISVPTTGFTPD